ncbi:MAG TPA: exodeoxyribonuclease VII large subunit [Syntrophobacteraceae bacterium]|nr:exodeoxyribonuclease VII large subunit [Syntrophobacteraceae bacterium]
MRQQALAETHVYTVSELNAEIRDLLESRYPFVWVTGEISNFRVPSSGHFYFTLKDEQSQIRGVFFRSQNRYLRFVPESGIQVVCRGRLGVYEPRGEYQFIVDVMEPRGLGALQLAFEQLKKKLGSEGLFDASRKKPMPLCPRRVAVVTSSTGAAVRDILKVLERSPYPLEITILPVRVQGQGAAEEIAGAIRKAGELRNEFGWDVLLVGRGGGSIEDLWAFNEEAAARALASCPIPTISAVGHEIDYTISDFVADLRVPTPTAGAQWVLRRMEEFQRELAHGTDRMVEVLRRKIEGSRQAVEMLEKRLVSPRRRLEDWKLFLDDRLERMHLAMARRMERQQTSLAHLVDRLRSRHPSTTIQQSRIELCRLQREMAFQLSKNLEARKYRLQEYASRLDSLSPLAVLQRGYAIGYRLEDMAVLRNSGQVCPGDEIGLRLSQGALKCTVQGEWETTPLS